MRLFFGIKRRQLKEKEALLDALSEGVLTVDKKRRIQTVNRAACQMIGLGKKELIGQPLMKSAWTGSPLLEKCATLLEICQSKQSSLTDSHFVEGKKIYLELLVTSLSSQGETVILLQDKSGHHKVVEMGKDFVANASHELRTPLTIIRGFAETLFDLYHHPDKRQGPPVDLPGEMIGDITDKIVRNCERMDTLIKNLLLLADLDNHPASRFQACDLIALTENCKQIMLSLHPAAEIALEKSQDVLLIDADPAILELAILNLLDNGVKYSPSPAQITITLCQRGAEVEMTIADKGIGISVEDREHIFERFYTVDKAHSRRLGGAGLGLSLVQTILHKHQGTISVASTPGQGSCFTLILPLQRSSQ